MLGRGRSFVPAPTVDPSFVRALKIKKKKKFLTDIQIAFKSMIEKSWHTYFRKRTGTYIYNQLS